MKFIKSCYVNLINFPAAIADYNQTIRLYPNHAAAYYHRSVCHEKLSNYGAALADFTKAIQVEPRNRRYFNGQHGETPLHYAALSGNLNLLDEAMKATVEVNTADNDGHTPLYYAISSGNKPYIATSYLIAKNAHVNLVNNGGYSLLDKCLMRFNSEMSQDEAYELFNVLLLLLSYGAKIRPQANYKFATNQTYNIAIDWLEPEHRSLILGLIIKTSLEHGNPPTDVRAFINRLDPTLTCADRSLGLAQPMEQLSLNPR